ncbi:DUF523 domain-containing protein (plasmid) [Ensifer adhaerens]|uniref:DUF523 domain-containing protein n=1 Tax=Ensifer adhaerens TaxID=106592 RepID=UPI0023A914DC|nr:DUF523 domain-containing protein [Ensifer adhaerens]WDZ81716.1 DUF523 domain-containing protein [Ensifer adhaerens]
MNPKILVSACLLGERVRYDGSAKPFESDLLRKWQQEGWVVPLCPEVAAGFAIPRPPAEIEAEFGGGDVLFGAARVFENSGRDVTESFLQAARIAVSTATTKGCGYALLTDGSPACGSSFVYAGRYDGARKFGQGVVAAALREIGVAVYAQSEITHLAARLSMDAVR